MRANDNVHNMWAIRVEEEAQRSLKLVGTKPTLNPNKK